MAVDVEQLVGGALSGALVTSVLTPLIGQRLQRRDLRAAMLRAVGELERTRWADEDGPEAFREAVLASRRADARTRATVRTAVRDRQVPAGHPTVGIEDRRSGNRSSSYYSADARCSSPLMTPSGRRELLREPGTFQPSAIRRAMAANV
jgi:hypothetical protein